MAASNYITGRALAAVKFVKGRSFTVSAYKRRVGDGKIRYSDPVSRGSEPSPSVIYRVKVTPKRRFL